LQDGNVPLFAAVDAGNLNVCRELLGHETEAQVKFTKIPLKDTVLHLAARRRDNDLVKLFLEAGAGVDAQNVRPTHFLFQ
jgi:ankyrin repeat protein